jgi:hypothetical protein
MLANRARRKWQAVYAVVGLVAIHEKIPILSGESSCCLRYGRYLRLSQTGVTMNQGHPAENPGLERAQSQHDGYFGNSQETRLDRI